MNADLQDPAELIVKMAEAWLQGNSYVICERGGREDPVSSKIFSRIFYTYLRTMVITNFPTQGFDIFLVDKKYLTSIVGAGKNIHPIYFSYWIGKKPVVISYLRIKRPFGKSKWSFRKKISLLIDTTLGFSAMPMRLISMVGGIASFSSFCYGVYTLVYALYNGTPVPGYASIVCVLSFLLGLVIVMLSVIGEYLVRMYDVINNKPEYIIDEIF